MSTFPRQLVPPQYLGYRLLRPAKTRIQAPRVHDLRHAHASLATCWEVPTSRS